MTDYTLKTQNVLTQCLLYLGPELRKMLKWPRPLPSEEERVRLLHEVLYP